MYPQSTLIALPNFYLALPSLIERLIARTLAPLSPLGRTVPAKAEMPEPFERAASAAPATFHDDMYALFVGSCEGILELATVQRRRTLLERLIRNWLASQGRPTECRLHINAFGSYLALDVLTPGARSASLRPSGALRDATILLDGRLRFAAVRVHDGAELGFYASLASVATSGTTDALWRGAPIQVDPRHLPERVGEIERLVPGLEQVRLLRLRLGLEDGGALDLRKVDLQHGRLPDLNALNGFMKLYLELHPLGRVQGCPVAIAPPNYLWFDHRANGALVLHYLETCNLLRV